MNKHGSNIIKSDNTTGESGLNAEKKLLDLNKQVYVLKNDVIEKEFLINNLVLERSAILSSYSWRLTLPFREISRWIRSPKQQLVRYTSLIIQKISKLLEEGSIPARPKGFLLAVIERFRLIVEGQVVSMRNQHSSGFWEACLQKSSILKWTKSKYFLSLPMEKKVSELLGRIGSRKSFLKSELDPPLVSIIIPIYGQLIYTLTLVASILESSSNTKFEILIVDDNSPDNSAEILSSIPCLRVLKNSKNIGFLKSCNAGALAAKGQFLYFLNNDTIVLEGWLDSLVDVFVKHDDAGLVGSKLIYPDGRLQEAGGLVWKDASAWNYGRLQDPGLAKFNFLKKTDYCSGASIMVPKDVFFKVGCFDERYAPAYCEDTDLAFAMRSIGLEVYYQPKSNVIHFEGISNGTDLTKGVKSFQVRNQKLFKEKWNEELLKSHFNNGEFVFWANNRSRCDKTILVIDHHVPKFDKDAGSRTVYQVINSLLDNGFQVKFWPDNNFAENIYTDILEQLGVEVFYGQEYVNGFEEFIKENKQFIDCYFLSRPEVAIKYLDAIRAYSDAPVIYYGHDIHYLRLESELARNEGNNKKLLDEITKIRIVEERIWGAADLILYPSDLEVAHVFDKLKKECLTQVKVGLLPVFGYKFPKENIVPNLKSMDRGGIIFVGGFSHRPNVDGVLWFVKEVYPLICAALGTINLTIIGSNPPSEIIDLSSQFINVTGYITDEELSLHYSGTRVVVAPLRFGGGMKGKVIEAFYYGVPLVTTSIGAQGLQNFSPDLAIADDPKDFADLVIALYLDNNRWQALSEVQADIVRRNFSSEAMFNSFSKFLDTKPFDNAYTDS